MSGKRPASHELLEEPETKHARLVLDDSGDGNVEKPADGSDLGGDLGEEPTRRSSRARNQKGGGGKAGREVQSGGGKGKEKNVETQKMPPVTYKEGQGLGDHLFVPGQTVEVKIPAEHAVSGNPQVRARQLWGTDTYTSDSDLVAVLMHGGWYLPSASVPPSLVELRAVVKAVAPRDSYVSASRNGIRSRSWGATRTGVSISVHSCVAVLNPGKASGVSKHGGGGGALASSAKEIGKKDTGKDKAGPVVVAVPAPGPPTPPPVPGGVLATPAAAAAEPDVTVECVLSPNPHRVTCVVPTFFPNTVEQVVNTRHSAANSERRGKLIQEVTVQYNLVHEPWLKYSVAAVADEGFKKSQYTAARLRRESLFLESHAARYELSFDGDAYAVDGEGKALRSEDVYRFGKVISPKTLGETLTLGVPLPATELVDLKKKIAWADVKFGASAINVLGEEIKVVRLQFMARTS